MNKDLIDIEPVIRFTEKPYQLKNRIEKQWQPYLGEKIIHMAKPIYKKNYEAYLFCKVCLDDWENVWDIREFRLYIDANNPKEVREKIIAWLDKRYMNFEILFVNIKRIESEDK